MIVTDSPTPPCPDDPLGDEIAALCAHISAATCRLLTLLRVFDEEERWHGHRSCAHWLTWRTGISLGPAREKVRVARCLPALPLISAAFARGEISYSKVRALTRVATTDNEDELLTFADHGTTAHVERLVREWRRLDRGDAGLAARDARRGLTLYLADDGSYEIRGQLSPEVGALLAKALEATEEKLYRAQRAAGTEHQTTAAERRADAFGLWLEEHIRPQVQLVVHSFEAPVATGPAPAVPAEAPTAPATATAPPPATAAAQGEAPTAPITAESGRVSHEMSPPVVGTPSLVTEDGSRVFCETSSRLCCDAEIVPMTRGADGSVLDVGRRRRTVGWRLRKALDARDGGCRFPGCGSRLRTHAHHITHWARGGETAMHNLVLLCPFHHRAVHEEGWRVEMDQHGVPQFFNPLGVHMPVVPEVPDIGGLLSGGVSVEPPADGPAAEPADAAATPFADATGGSPADIPAAPLAPADFPPRATSDFGLARWHGQRGIGPAAGGSLWRGERIDWGWALACLWREGGDGGGEGAGVAEAR